MNFVQRVLAQITGGDEGKVARFFKRFQTGLEDQVEARRREKEEKKEIIEDLEETFQFELYNIEVNELKDTPAIKAYAQAHLEKLLKNRRKKKGVMVEIENLDYEIEHLQSIIKEVTEETK